MNNIIKNTLEQLDKRGTYFVIRSVMVSTLTLLFLYGSVMYHIAAINSADGDLVSMLWAMSTGLGLSVLHGMIVFMLGYFLNRYIIVPYEDSILDCYENDHDMYDPVDEYDIEDLYDNESTDWEETNDVSTGMRTQMLTKKNEMFFLEGRPITSYKIDELQNFLSAAIDEEYYEDATVIKSYIDRLNNE